MTSSGEVHLVTGGAGFLGTLITERLRARGATVRSLDLWRDPDAHPDVDLRIGDVRDRAFVADAMTGVDVVHHAAALVPLTKSGPEFDSVNVGGSRIVAEEAARAGVRAFVHISSSAVYGRPVDHPITSATPARPVEIYGRAKLAGEEAVQDVLRDGDVRLLIIRPRTILGRGRLGLYAWLFRWIRDGRGFYVIGRGDNPFQYVHADDLLDAWLLLLDEDQQGVFAVGTDDYGTFRQGLERLIAHAGTGSRVRSVPARPAVTALKVLDRLNLSPLAPWHYLTVDAPFACDVGPLLELGWTPRWSNDAMLAACYDEWLREGDSDGGSAHRRPVREGLLGLLRRVS